MIVEEVKCEVCERRIGFVETFNNDYDAIYCSKDCANFTEGK